MQRLAQWNNESADDQQKFEFIRLPDTTGFGDFTECGQMIPVRFRGEKGIFVHSMYLDDEAPISGGREIWGFPQKLARPKLCHESEVLVGTLHFGSVVLTTMSKGVVLGSHKPRPQWLGFLRPAYVGGRRSYRPTLN